MSETGEGSLGPLPGLSYRLQGYNGREPGGSLPSGCALIRFMQVSY